MPVSAFIAGERQRAAWWKRTTPLLPDEARADAHCVTGSGGDIEGPFAYCMPPQLTAHNVLPPSREALDVFARLGIPWHAGVAGGPSNHVLDSQVQCVNALAPVLHDPAGVRATFGRVLDIEEVLELRMQRYHSMWGTSGVRSITRR